MLAIRNKKRNWLGRIVHNAGADAIDIVTGIPGAVKEAGRGLAIQGARGYAISVLPANAILGDRFGGSAANKWAERQTKQTQKIVEATVDQYKQTYGPLLRGDLKKFGSNVAEHPLFIALDAAGGYGAAGKAVGAVTRLAPVASRAAEGGLVERLAARAADSPHLEKPARTLTIRGADDAMESGTPVALERSILSRNPVTREFIQRPLLKVKDRAADAVHQAAEAADVKPFTEDATARRVARRRMLDLSMQSRDAASRNRELATQAFVEATRSLDKTMPAKAARAGAMRGEAGRVASMARAERDAVMLHATGMLGVPGMTGVQNLRAVIDMLQKGVDQARADGKRSKLPQQQIDRLRHLEDRPELLEYGTLPASVRDAVDVARTTVSDSQREAVRIGLVSAETAREVPGRAAREVIGGEEDIQGIGGEGLRTPKQQARVESLEDQLQVAQKRASALTKPAPRREALAKVREVRTRLRRAQKFSVTRQHLAAKELDTAQRLLGELSDGSDTSVVPRVARGDAEVVTNPDVARAASELERARNRVAALDSAVKPEIHRSAVSMIPTHREKTVVAGKRKAKLRFRRAEHYYSRVEDEVRDLAATTPKDARTLQQILEDQSPIGDPVTVGGRRRALTDKQLQRRAEQALEREGVEKPRTMMRPAPAVNKTDVESAGRRQRAWEENEARVNEYQARVEERVSQLRGADEEALRPLSAREAAALVQREIKGASRSKTELAAERIAAAVGYRVPQLEMIRGQWRQRLDDALAAERADGSAVNRRRTQRVAREVQLVDAAYRAGVARRLRDAEPEVRAQAIAQGLIDDTAETTNPRAVAAILDERDAAAADVVRLERELGLGDEHDPDVLFGGGDTPAGGEVERRSARELRDENTALVHAPASVVEPTAEQARQYRRVFGGQDGPRRMLEAKIQEEKLDRAAVRAGYQPKDITARIADTYEELAKAESDLAVARTSEVGTRSEVDRARRQVALLRKELQLFRSPGKLRERVRALEARVHSGKITDDEYLELADLRDMRGSGRTSPAPAEWAERIPTVREFMRRVTDGSPPAFRGLYDVAPDVEVLPDVVRAASRTDTAINEYTRAVRDGEHVQAAERRVAQAYYLEREARIDGARRVYPEMEWRDVPEAEHLPAVPFYRKSGGARPAVNALRGRTTPDKVKRGEGVLRRGGGAQLADERQVMEHAGRVAFAKEQINLVPKVIEDFGLRRGGKLVSGRMSLEGARVDLDKWVPIRRSSLTKIFEKAEDLAEGEWLDRDTINSVLRGKGRGDAEAMVHASPDDVFFIPREVGEEWADALRPGKLKGYDTVMDYWKAGVLALHPRWYVYNLVGNTLQYGLMSLGDLGSILDMAKASRRNDIRRALGQRGRSVHHASLARDQGLPDVLNAGPFRRVTAFGFRINERMEGFLRDTAMWSATKKEMRLAGRTRRASTPEQVMKALDGIDADSPILREAERTALLFLGDYRRFSPMERKVLRRVFPFYSWLRVIGKLTMMLPIKHPVRTSLVSLMAQAVYAGMPEEDRALERLRNVYDRGAIDLPGGVSLRTTAANPFATVAPWIEAVSNMSGTELAQAFVPSASFVIAPAVQKATGRSLFNGRDYSAPPGWDDTVQVYGRPAMRVNPTTGRVEDAPPPSPSFLEMVGQSMVPYWSTVRKGVSAGERPYDTAGTGSIILNRAFGVGDRTQLFKPAQDPNDVMSGPVGPGGIVSTLSGELGAPLSRRNSDAERRFLLSQYQAMEKARASMARRVARMKAGG